ncbi:hypothetical protein BST81_22295 [Leptolyngbya sp. 'hensonii']|uniref:PP2C family serine/threonine-protein phosphatase n=1 Tax=Leptolyngbya sp. 'hensonii' TaxID=1922337 RepID=UPI00094FCF55|nr:protein phosphatase 2C domain-containing protein [Leptolyngbya sp. 'hensonii']OLP16138.1 hypothetical protein BST81_22295 [Leptolyngbya sp. 'hensonii']
MKDRTAAIYCPNISCQTLNPEDSRFCRHCHTPIPARYLWAAGQDITPQQPGEMLYDRYLVKTSRILLDTQPGLPPEAPAEITDEFEVYLHLFPFHLHIPQPYVALPGANPSSPPILLLEQAPIQPQGTALWPTLGQSWGQATALRQLNWLWQMAQLWHPLHLEGVAATLLEAHLIRTEGSLIRLLELRSDGPLGIQPALSDLGHWWSQLPPAQPEIAPFFTDLCLALTRGQITAIEQVSTHLDAALKTCGQGQARQVELVCLSDQGPTRQRNEDACYPPSGFQGRFNLQESVSEADSPLLIVCDGIGGHEGGNVASNLAIEAIRQQVPSFSVPANEAQSTDRIVRLEDSVRIANDQIAQRNDSENRQDRQRMGTTLVMALPQGHEIYITHVGDSRAYRITPQGCHQVTLDDDFAAREVRLGYTFYRDALQNPVAGSLIQALGMAHSNNLHPTTQRLILDEDCLFLLCSDGLSDFDRVEALWETELLPSLTGHLDLATAGRHLVELANSWNGHDNVTVGLLYCQVQELGLAAEPISFHPAITHLAQPSRSSVGHVSESSLPLRQVPQEATIQVTRGHDRPIVAPFSLSWPVFLGGLALVSLGGVLTFLFMAQDVPLSPIAEPVPSLKAPAPESPSSTATSSPTLPALTAGSLVQINSPAIQPGQTENLPETVVLLPQPGIRPQQTLPSASGPDSAPRPSLPLPAGTILRIISRQEITSREYWFKLEVCSIPPAGVNSPPGTLRPGRIGWIQQDVLVRYASGSPALEASQEERCGSVQPPGSPLQSPLP